MLIECLPKWQTYLKDRSFSVVTETNSATLQRVKGESGLGVESAAATEIRSCQFPCLIKRGLCGNLTGAHRWLAPVFPQRL